MANSLVTEANRACLDACTDCAQACEACVYNDCLPTGAEMSHCGQAMPGLRRPLPAV